MTNQTSNFMFSVADNQVGTKQGVLDIGRNLILEQISQSKPTLKWEGKPFLLPALLVSTYQETRNPTQFYIVVLNLCSAIPFQWVWKLDSYHCKTWNISVWDGQVDTQDFKAVPHCKLNIVIWIGMPKRMQIK